jgi:hypothetical protein
VSEITTYAVCTGVPLKRGRRKAGIRWTVHSTGHTEEKATDLCLAMRTRMATTLVTLIPACSAPLVGQSYDEPAPSYPCADPKLPVAGDE